MGKTARKILQVPPRLGKKVSYGASKDAKTYLQSRIKYNRYNLLTAITARRETDEMYVIKARGKPSGYENMFMMVVEVSQLKTKKPCIGWINLVKMFLSLNLKSSSIHGIPLLSSCS